MWPLVTGHFGKGIKLQTEFPSACTRSFPPVCGCVRFTDWLGSWWQKCHKVKLHFHFLYHFISLASHHSMLLCTEQQCPIGLQIPMDMMCLLTCAALQGLWLTYNAWKRFCFLQPPLSFTFCPPQTMSALMKRKSVIDWFGSEAQVGAYEVMQLEDISLHQVKIVCI